MFVFSVSEVYVNIFNLAFFGSVVLKWDLCT